MLNVNNRKFSITHQHCLRFAHADDRLAAMTDRKDADTSEGGITAQRAKEALRASELSQRHVAASIGIDETKLSKSLSGRRRFGTAELLGLATATGVTVGELFR